MHIVSGAVMSRGWFVRTGTGLEMKFDTDDDAIVEMLRHNTCSLVHECACGCGKPEDRCGDQPLLTKDQDIELLHCSESFSVHPQSSLPNTSSGRLALVQDMMSIPATDAIELPIPAGEAEANVRAAFDRLDEATLDDDGNSDDIDEAIENCERVAMAIARALDGKVGT